MANAKRRKLMLQQRRHQKTQARPSSRPAPVLGKSGKQQRQRQKQQQHETLVIPFEPHHRILLVGDGDLSFAASIVRYHGCVNVTATMLEKNYKELVAKHPSAEANIAIVLGDSTGSEAVENDDQDDEASDDSENDQGAPLRSDAMESDEEASCTYDDHDDDSSDHDGDDTSTPDTHKPSPPISNKLLYGVDATKLPPSLHRPPRFDRILFNFPHVGGKSTDVNRQVRHNQSLIVSFFKSALGLLAPRAAIVVTLFDGEPYSLWNIRDLARHAGLAVERSFAFSAAAYPGYRHARTGGVVRNRKGETGGGWKGEHRPARSFIFRRKDEMDSLPLANKKRLRDTDSSDDDDEG